MEIESGIESDSSNDIQQMNNVKSFENEAIFNQNNLYLKGKVIQDLEMRRIMSLPDLLSVYFCSFSTFIEFFKSVSSSSFNYFEKSQRLNK